MKCSNIQPMVFVTSQAKKNILSKQCDNTLSVEKRLTFFSDQEIMRIIRKGKTGNLFLLFKSDNVVNIKMIKSIEEAYSYCN